MISKRSGFTLVELSIVLVIIGLLVGGVVGGQSLVHSARLNKVVGKFKAYSIAYNNFQLQYDAVPGDMTNGYEYWGGNCMVGNAGDEEDRCNGNGNGYVSGGSGDEGFMFWRHLQLADMLAISVTGNRNDGWANIGVTLPKAPIAGAGFAVGWKAWGSNIKLFGRSGNHVHMSSVSGNYLTGASLTPKDAKAIDKKMDDGAADKGDLRSAYISGNACTDGANPLDLLPAAYDVSNTGTVCRITYFFD